MRSYLANLGRQVRWFLQNEVDGVVPVYPVAFAALFQMVCLQTYYSQTGALPDCFLTGAKLPFLNLHVPAVSRIWDLAIIPTVLTVFALMYSGNWLYEYRQWDEDFDGEMPIIYTLADQALILFLVSSFFGLALGAIYFPLVFLLLCAVYVATLVVSLIVSFINGIMNERNPHDS